MVTRGYLMTPRATSSNVRAIVDAATMPMTKKAVIRTSIIALLRSDYRQFFFPKYAAACILTVHQRLLSAKSGHSLTVNSMALPDITAR